VRDVRAVAAHKPVHALLRRGDLNKDIWRHKHIVSKPPRRIQGSTIQAKYGDVGMRDAPPNVTRTSVPTITAPFPGAPSTRTRTACSTPRRI
jgi:hypothetical protein